MAIPLKYQTKEVLNKVLNTGEDALNVDLSDSVTVTVDSEFPAASAISDNFANPTTTSAMSMLMGWDTSTWDRVQIGGGTQAAALRVTIASDSTGVLSIDDNGGNISIDDGGNTITVDGTVTANLGSTDNTVLDNIDSNTDYGATTGGGTESGALRVTIASNSTGVVSVDDNGSTLTVDVASGGIASGAIASGAVASGAVASGAIASGALASGSVVDGAMVTLGAKADAKSTATDTTAITAMQVLKQISASVQEVATDTGTIDSDTNDIKTATESSNTHLGNMFYDTALAVTPSDGSDLTGEPFYAVYVGTGGNLKVDMSDGGAAVTLSNVASGQLLPIMVERIYSTGTTASNIIAFK